MVPVSSLRSTKAGILLFSADNCSSQGAGQGGGSHSCIESSSAEGKRQKEKKVPAPEEGVAALVACLK